MNKTINKPQPGDVLSVNRGLYKHYGVYVGNNTVVHFSGGSSHELSARKACIRKTTLDDFSKGEEMQIETRCAESFSRKETVMRALNAVGSEKGKYALPWNNCEHFANWCRYGKKRSVQVEQFATQLAGISAVVLGTVLIGKIIKEGNYMMNLNFSVGLSICIALQGIMLLLYFYDPDIFISRYLIRTSKIKFFLKSSFGKSGKAHKEKWHKLRTTIECCEEAISKYVNKKNLSTLQDDETLKNLLIVYRELLDMNESADSELSLGMIQEAKYKVEDLYFPAMDPYYEYDMEEAI